MLFNRGLVVGKFCPLHGGHQLLIQRAIQSCAEVVVISYTKPEFENCGPINRERWISELFPTVRRLVIDDETLQSLCRAKGIGGRVIPHNDASNDVHRDFVGWLCWSVLGTAVDAVFTSEDYGDGFADALTRYFHTHANRVGSVQHICVDQPRAAMPICGTDVRSDPHEQRRFLAPVVYSDLVPRVAILGGESSGKTTLAQGLASHFDTACVPEYGRELWDKQNGQLQLGDMLEIAAVQVAQEQLLGRDAHRWLFCDTTPLTTSFYSQEMFGHVDPELERLASRCYYHIVLCEPDFGFVQDGTRRGVQFRDQQHRWYVHELQDRGLQYSLITGSIAERVSTVVSQLAALKLRPAC